MAEQDDRLENQSANSTATPNAGAHPSPDTSVNQLLELDNDTDDLEARATGADGDGEPGSNQDAQTSPDATASDVTSTQQLSDDLTKPANVAKPDEKAEGMNKALQGFVNTIMQAAQTDPQVAQLVTQAMSGSISQSGNGTQPYPQNGTQAFNGFQPQQATEPEPTPQMFMPEGTTYDPHQASIPGTPHERAKTASDRAYSQWLVRQAIREHDERNAQTQRAEAVRRQFDEDTVATARAFGEDEAGQQAFRQTIDKVFDRNGDQKEVMRLIYIGQNFNKLVDIEIAKRAAEKAAKNSGSETPHGQPTGLNEAAGYAKQTPWANKSSDKGTDDLINA